MTLRFGLVLPPRVSAPNPPNPDLVAAIAHFFIGFSAPLAATVLVPRNDAAPIAGAGAVLGFAALKDGLYDTAVEGDNPNGNLQDVCQYALGALAGTALVALTRGRP